MESPEDQQRNRPRGKDRTRVACCRCNSKKVKCNAALGVACTGCRVAQTECVLIDSQRGRYIRRKGPLAERQPQQQLQQLQQQHQLPQLTQQLPPQHQAQQKTPASSSDESPLRDLGLSPATSQKLKAEYHHPSIVLPPQNVEPVDGQLFRGLSRSFERRAPTDSSALLYMHIADQSVRPTQQPISDAISTFYAGDSFSLTYAIHDVLAPFLSDRRNYQKRLHFPIAEGFDPSDQGRENIVNSQIALLRERNLYYRLSETALERLLDVYFRWFHPAFPLVNQTNFVEKCHRNQMSLLVLNGMLLVAAIMCDPADIAMTGCENRAHARSVFYRQARALYDAELDPDKVNNVTAVFFISFWWGGSNDEKDSWHWLGVCVSLAQSLGMHRSTAKSHMSDEKSRHWRRIWWCIRIRDTIASGSTGRPLHISHRDCDVEPLEPGDMDDGGHLGAEESLYACQMANLSIIFGRIVKMRYAAIQSTSLDQKEQMENDLEAFRMQVPAALQYRGINPETGQGMWSAMILMAYNYSVILLYRPTSTGNDPVSTFWGDRPKAVAAANEITRAMEDVLSTSFVRLSQIHTIPALFNSLSMHVFSLCTSGSVGRELAENRARTCMLGLNCLQESWPVSGWILKLFVDIIERLRRMLTNRSKSGELSRVTASPVPGHPQPSQNLQLVGTLQSISEQTQAPLVDMTAHPMDPLLKPPLEMPTGGLAVYPSEFAPYSTTNAALFPNLFVLDDLFANLDAGQVSFFDSLEVPNYDVQGMSYQ
ncbi:fungal-specific transcription factor domain-containing protein [Trichoderma austrokoningii]